jgi:hypothetical protein
MTEHDFCIWLDGLLTSETYNSQSALWKIKEKLKTVTTSFSLPKYVPGKYYEPVIVPLTQSPYTIGDPPFNPYIVTCGTSLVDDL